MKPLARVTKAAADARHAALVRDEMIRWAHQEGETIRAVAAAANLSPARIHQIVKSA